MDNRADFLLRIFLEFIIISLCAIGISVLAYKTLPVNDYIAFTFILVGILSLLSRIIIIGRGIGAGEKVSFIGILWIPAIMIVVYAAFWGYGIYLNKKLEECIKNAPKAAEFQIAVLRSASLLEKNYDYLSFQINLCRIQYDPKWR